MGRRGYPLEFWCKVLDLVEAGRPVAEIAHDLGVGDQLVYTWRRQGRIDRGLDPGLTSSEKTELAQAKRRIAELETELRDPAGDRAYAKGGVPGSRYGAVQVMAAEDIPVEVSCRVRDVSVSGYDEWLARPPSARSVRHAWLTDRFIEVHQHSRGTYGSRRVHAELRRGRGVQTGHTAIEMLMRRAGLAGVSGRRGWPAQA